MKGERALAYGAFAIVCTIWGTTYLGIRIAIETLPTFLFAGVRFTLAGSILLLICLLRGEKLPARRSDYLNLALIGLLLIGVGNVAVVWAEHYVSSGFAALLVATSPLWMAALESMRAGGDRINRRRALGMLVGFAGVALLVAPAIQPGTFNANVLLGVLALQGGSIAWNLGSIRSKYHYIDAPPLVSASIQMISGGLIVSLIGVFAGEIPRFHFNARTLAAFLYLVVFGSVLAYGAYVYALSKLRTSTVSLYAYINPIVAVVLGWLVLSERLGWREVIAMAVIFAGVALVQSGSKRRMTVQMENKAALRGRAA